MTSSHSVALERANINSYAKEGLKIFGASIFIAVSAQIAVPLFSIPFSFETFAIILCGWMLGSKRAALAVLAFLCEGAMGFPVFAHGTSGIAKLMGPCGGYLASYLLAVIISGYITYGTTKILRLAL